jgi:hypothetical protein
MLAVNKKGTRDRKQAREGWKQERMVAQAGQFIAVLAAGRNRKHFLNFFEGFSQTARSMQTMDFGSQGSTMMMYGA